MTWLAGPSLGSPRPGSASAIDRPMTKLRDPQPIGTFDPSRSALLHECRADCVLVWDPRKAADWRATARPHPEGVEWNGYIFDVWATGFAVP